MAKGIRRVFLIFSALAAAAVHARFAPDTDAVSSTAVDSNRGISAHNRTAVAPAARAWGWLASLPSLTNDDEKCQHDIQKKYNCTELACEDLKPGTATSNWDIEHGTPTSSVGRGHHRCSRVFTLMVVSNSCAHSRPHAAQRLTHTHLPPHSTSTAGYINYIEFYECTTNANTGLQFLAFVLFLSWMLFLLHLVETTTNDYFCTSLQLAVAILQLSPNVRSPAVSSRACELVDVHAKRSPLLSRASRSRAGCGGDFSGRRQCRVRRDCVNRGWVRPRRLLSVQRFNCSRTARRPLKACVLHISPVFPPPRTALTVQRSAAVCRRSGWAPPSAPAFLLQPP